MKDGMKLMSTFTTSEKRSRDVFDFSILTIVSILVIVASIIIGGLYVSFSDFFSFISGSSVDDYVRNILIYIRIPRALGGFICGVSLSISGLLLQTSLRNSLASPSTIGVNAGAGLFVVIASLIFPGNIYAKTAFAFVGAVLIALIVYIVASKTGASTMTIILSGVAITSLCNAIIDTIIKISPNTTFTKTDFYIGGLSLITYNQVISATIITIVMIVIVLIFSRQIEILKIGNDLSHTLGINVKVLHLIVIICAAFLAASSVAIAGLLGFIGLIIPHISLLIFGGEVRTLLIKTGLLGGIALVLCDLLARVIFSPYELPVGIILSFLGAPFFIYLLFSGKKRRGIYD